MNKLLKKILSDVEEDLNQKMTENELKGRYVKKEITMEELWKEYYNEKNAQKGLKSKKKRYATIYFTLEGLIRFMDTKDVDNDKEACLFLANKIEEYAELLKKYYGEE